MLSKCSYRGDVLRFTQWHSDWPIDKALIENSQCAYLDNNTPPYLSPASATCSWMMSLCPACCPPSPFPHWSEPSKINHHNK